MKDKFDIHQWRHTKSLNEGIETLSNDDIKKLYNHIIKKLDGPAKDAGLRMSIFEQEFPSVLAFSLELNKIK